ncbi:5-carboxymethyl-2-hydroxymuconate isomerase [Vibrio vulnificus YJ016]|uniref:5-carboxymethyl-2-hydroxymuconate isomerase n=3 Tax=Vibrio vulnificus TaxID=672 RepID=Q7MH48_VIBVY|nr:5-carboxymethyl-2-hydroxymuconate isomerase [Vibrio vulnificus YJ016]
MSVSLVLLYVSVTNRKSATKGSIMPNLVLEYSNSVEERVNIPGLLEDLHHIAIKSGLFDAPSVKSRTLRCHHWLIGEEGDSVDFIHVSFDLLSGRTEEQKRELSRQLMAALQETASHVRSLTVNIRDMDKDSFQKVVN